MTLRPASVKAGGRIRRGGAPACAATFVIAAACCAVGVGIGLTGCPSSAPTLPYTPYTGINFVSETILAGAGCGTAPGQVFKYAVVIGDPSDAGSPNLSSTVDGAPGAYASLVDCNTNGVFTIGTSPDGGPTVEAWIYAYDETDFEAAQASVTSFASCAEPTCPLSVADVQAIIGTYSTYTTTCTATPESGDNVVASCLPLRPHAPADGGPDALP